MGKERGRILGGRRWLDDGLALTAAILLGITAGFLFAIHQKWVMVVTPGYIRDEVNETANIACQECGDRAAEHVANECMKRFKSN